MANHDVPIDGYGQDCKNGDRHEAVSEEWKKNAERVPVDPTSIPENGDSQWEIEATEHEVTDAEVNDEVRSRIVDLEKSRN